LIDPAEKRYVSSGSGPGDTLDPTSSHGIMVRLVGHGKRVLDVGCADGFLCRHLTNAGNRVTGIDVDERAVEEARAHCERAIAADFDRQPLPEAVGGETFDAIVFGDVLEHVRDPWRLLDQARSSLSERGFAVISILNIAHGNVRLSLLRGAFDYARFGLLDDSHLRFFTLRSVRELCLRAGYRVESIERTKVPLFGESDLVPHVLEREFGADVVDEIRRDPDHDTLQFVIRAVPLADGDQLRVALDELSESEAKLVAAHGTIDRLEHLLDARHRDGERLAALEAANVERQAALERERSAATESRERLAAIESNLAEREKYAAADAEDQRVALAEELAAVRAREEDREDALERLRAETTELRAHLLEASRSVGEAYALRSAVDQAHATLASVHDSMQSKVRDAEDEIVRARASATQADLETAAVRAALDELRREYEALGESERDAVTAREALAAHLAEVEHLARTRETAAAETLADLRGRLTDVSKETPTAAAGPSANSGTVTPTYVLEARSAPSVSQREAIARIDAELQRTEIARKATVEAFARHIDFDTSMVRAEMAEIDALIRRMQNGKVWRAKAFLGRVKAKLRGGRARV
jgi:SAM-dependent methyltransferase